MGIYDHRKEEERKRRQAEYYLRNLLVDDTSTLLSTISEEDESGVQYSPKTPSGYDRTRHYETPYRSPSPLPDLIVEVVPRRPKIYDDEPEEFYKRLEKQMRKLYRREILNLPSSSSDSTEPQSDFEFHTFEEDCIDELYIDEPHGLSPITEETTIEKITSSISIEIGANRTETPEEYTVQSSAETEESSKKEESEDKREEEPMELAENSDASLDNESVSLSPILEPDAMRRQKTRSSQFSIGNRLEPSRSSSGKLETAEEYTVQRSAETEESSKKEESEDKREEEPMELAENNVLSTISEEDESGVQYSPKTPSGYDRTRHYETPYRSPSPLPDLIVEVVPRRPKIYDDEPEEFYKRLEKQMRKLYRREILNLPSSSSDSTEPQSDFEFHTFEEDCIDELYIDEPHGLSPITKETTIEKITSSISIEIGANRTETPEEYTVQRSAETEESSKKEESEDKREEEPMELAENSDASLDNESVSLSPILRPDAMRRQKTRSSQFSIGNDFEKSTKKIVPYHRKQLLEFMEESVENRDQNIIPTITDITGKITSTPSSSHKSYTLRKSKRKRFCDRFEPSRSSSGKLETAEEYTVQRSAETEESSKKEESEDKREEEPMELAENNDASLDNESVSLSPILRPDAMRRQKTRSSQFSIGNDFEKSTKKIVPYHRKQLLEFMEESVENRDQNIIPTITDITGKTTSTPSSSHKSYTLRKSKRKRFCDRFEPSRSSSGKLETAEEYTVQRSAETEESSKKEESEDKREEEPMELAENNGANRTETPEEYTVQRSAETEESSKKEESEDKREEEPMELAENSDASLDNESVSLSPILRPDAMRRQKTRSSQFSIGNDFEKSTKKIIPYHRKQLLEFMEESVENRDQNIIPTITDITGKITSTPSSSHKSYTLRKSKRKRFCDRFEPSRSSSGKLETAEEYTVQRSAETEESSKKEESEDKREEEPMELAENNDASLDNESVSLSPILRPDAMRRQKTRSSQFSIGNDFEKSTKKIVPYHRKQLLEFMKESVENRDQNIIPTITDITGKNTSTPSSSHKSYTLRKSKRKRFCDRFEPSRSSSGKLETAVEYTVQRSAETEESFKKEESEDKREEEPMELAENNDASLDNESVSLSPILRPDAMRRQKTRSSQFSIGNYFEKSTEKIVPYHRKKLLEFMKESVENRDQNIIPTITDITGKTTSTPSSSHKSYTLRKSKRKRFCDRFEPSRSSSGKLETAEEYTVQRSAETEESSKKEESEDKREEEPMELAENNDASLDNESVSLSPILRPDAMRRQKTRSSQFSIGNYFEKSTEKIVPYHRKKLLEFMKESVENRDQNIIPTITDITGKTTSTPSSSHKSYTLRKSKRKRFCDRFEPSRSSSGKLETAEEYTVQRSAETEESSKKEESEDKREEEPMELAENNDASLDNESVSLSPILRPDAMRRQKTRSSQFSIGNYFEKSTEKIVPYHRKKLLEFMKESVENRDQNIIPTITDITGKTTSTPSSSHKSYTLRKSKRKRFCDRFEPSRSSSGKLETAEEYTVQRSAETEESSKKEESEDKREEEPMELAENNDASLDNESVSLSPILRPDAMRRQKTRSSQFSIGNDFEKSTKKIVPYHRKQLLEFMEESVENRDQNIIPTITDITGKTTSTPSSSHKSYTLRKSKRKRFCDRFEPSRSSSGKSFRIEIGSEEGSANIFLRGGN